LPLCPASKSQPFGGRSCTTAEIWGLACLAVTLSAATATAQEWRFYGGDPGGRHYSGATQINTGNVSGLEVAWVHRSGDLERYGEALANTSTQSTPILLPEAAGESLVYCTPFNRVIALDPETGTQRWSFDPVIDRGGDRTFRCRGVSYWEETRLPRGEPCRHRLFMNTHDRRLIAIDAQTGAPCQRFGNRGEVVLHGKRGFPPGDVSNSSAPVVADSVVVTGSTIIDFVHATTARGTVQAFDTLTGTPQWQFDPLRDHPRSGSANVWAPISVDEKNGLVYLPTSAPSPDYYGVDRPGDNQHANSVVALDLHSGELRWSFQHVRHDLWDYDTPAQPILFQWQQAGKDIPALAQLTKQGFIFILDRLTGKSLWEITEQPVPPSQVPGEQAAAYQPKPMAPPQLLNTFLMPDDAWGLTPFDRWDCRAQLAALHNLGLFTPPGESRTLLYPGSLGGPNWGGGALLEESDILLVNVTNAAFTSKLTPTRTRQAARRDHPTDGQTMQVTMHGTPYDVELQSLTSFLGIPCNPPPWGKLLAVDLREGIILWETALGSIHEMGPFPLPFHIEWGTPNLGGGIATAGGLFFIAATMDRQIRAFDVSNGDTLWQYTLPVDATATPMTYVHRGVQYVVVNAGGHAMYNRGYGDYLYAFALKRETP